MGRSRRCERVRETRGERRVGDRDGGAVGGAIGRGRGERARGEDSASRGLSARNGEGGARRRVGLFVVFCSFSG